MNGFLPLSKSNFLKCILIDYNAICYGGKNASYKVQQVWEGEYMWLVPVPGQGLNLSCGGKKGMLVPGSGTEQETLPYVETLWWG